MPTKLYVANLASGCSETDLQGLFAKFGVVTELDIIKDYAFVHMESQEAAQEAVANLNNENFQGFVIQVQFSRIQSVNRSNKSTMRYDRPEGNFRGRGRGDFPGRDQFQGREGFHGAAGHARGGGGDFRGRGGFRGGRGGFDGFHHGRGKPYDRSPAFNPPAFQGQNIEVNLNTNLQPIRPAGSPANFVRPSITPQKNFARPPLNSPANFLNQVPLQQQQFHIAPVHHQQPLPTAIPVHSQVNAIYQSQSIINQQMPYQQLVNPQPLPVYNNDPLYQNTHLGQPIPGTMPAQFVSQVSTAIQPQAAVQPVMQNPGLQAGGMPQPGQGGPPLGYTVYERYVDYRSPQGQELQAMQQQQNQGPVTAVYQQPPPVQPPTNKDPYTSAQIQYERHAVATSRAAVYANAYYGNNAVAVPASNVLQAVPVGGQGPVLQPVPMHYHQ